MNKIKGKKGFRGGKKKSAIHTGELLSQHGVCRDKRWRTRAFECHVARINGTFEYVIRKRYTARRNDVQSKCICRVHCVRVHTHATTLSRINS